MSPTLLFIFILVVHVFTIIDISCNAKPLPKYPAILVFGDSTVDTGNNNFIDAAFPKADHYPYGKDFPDNIATGRFSNGKLIPDFAAFEVGINKTIPPFLNPNLTDHDIRTGVCFASSGSGYDDPTVLKTIIPMSQQLENFKIYLEKLKKIVGKEEAKKIVNGALVIMSAGTNDFTINIYGLPTRNLRYGVSGYQDFIQNRIRDYVTELYGLGCRQIFVTGLPPIGCLPLQMTFKFSERRTCLEDQNSDSQSYNQKLKLLLSQLQISLPGSRVAYADIYEPLMDMIKNPEKYGFVTTDRGCCGSGLFETGPLCNANSKLCENASQYLFWDAIHPSQAAYQYLIKSLEKTAFTNSPRKHWHHRH